ncbi:MAG TPA: LAGLIDADG family homing endonuclease [Candidatus Paceibacterota bacterium]|nr:LAGLIDADG family homing endonuclease [Candidatus Paceibacterota bacterium]
MNKNSKLSGDYIAGFVDGEGCFALKFRKDIKYNTDNKFREYYYWGVEFAIVLRSDDVHILELIKDKLCCGSITYAKNNEQVRYSIQNTKDLSEKVVPFFKQHRLMAKKAVDFVLWSQAVEILNKHKTGILNVQVGTRGFIKKELSEEDDNKLTKIRNQMLNYKSSRNKKFKWGS